MQVICVDGTRFSCNSYEVIDGGVKLFGVDVEQEDGPTTRYGPDADEHQIGFVPDGALRYILPDGVRPATHAGIPDRAPATPPPRGGGGSGPGPRPRSGQSGR